MLQRLREACRTPHDPLSGIVEIDETFIGGFEGNKHESKKLKAGRGMLQQNLFRKILQYKIYICGGKGKITLQ